MKHQIKQISDKIFMFFFNLIVPKLMQLEGKQRMKEIRRREYSPDIPEDYIYDKKDFEALIELQELQDDFDGLSSYNYLSSLLLLIFYLPFFIFSNRIGLLIYGSLVILFILDLSHKFKSEIIFNVHPRDYIKFQVICLIYNVISFSFVFYTIYLFDINSFENKGNGLNLFDFLYYSLVTITTLGYGDIYPTSLLSKIFTSFEIITSIWFLISILPSALSFETSRLYDYHSKKMRFMKNIYKKVNESKADKNDVPKSKPSGDL